jgi:hypothetical protein
MLRLQTRRRRGRGQATLEFAFMLPLYLLVFFAAVDSALWAIQTGAAVSSAEVAARLAASVQVCTGPPSCASGSLIIDTAGVERAPVAAEVTAGVRKQLQQAMFGTTVVPWCHENAGRAPDQRTSSSCTNSLGKYSRCPDKPEEVLNSDVLSGAGGPGISNRTIAVCVEVEDLCAPLPQPCGESPNVTVKIIGYLASLVPPALSIGWKAGQIPLNVGARIHAQRFNP